MKYLFILLILTGAINAYLSRTPDPTQFKSSLDAPELVKAANGDELVLYSAVWCPYCKQAKDWLAENKIAYRDCDVEKEAACHAHMQAMNTRGVPVMAYKGKVNYGFNAEWVKAAMQSP